MKHKINYAQTSMDNTRRPASDRLIIQVKLEDYPLTFTFTYFASEKEL